MLIKINTNDYEIKRGRYSGGSCQIGIPKKWKNKELNIIPIPFDKKEKIKDNIIRLESNVIYLRKASNREKGNTINIPKIHIGNDLLIFPAKDNIRISSDFQNNIIRKAYLADKSSCVSLPKKYANTVISAFPLESEEDFKKDKEYKIKEVINKPTGERKYDVLLYLPKIYVDKYILCFEDDYYEF